MAVAQCTFDWRIPSDSNSGFHQHIYSRYICLEIDVSATLFLFVMHRVRQGSRHRLPLTAYARCNYIERFVA